MALHQIKSIYHFQPGENFDADNNLLTVTFDTCETVYLQFDPDGYWKVANGLAPQSLVDLKRDIGRQWIVEPDLSDRWEVDHSLRFSSIGCPLLVRFYNDRSKEYEGSFTSNGMIVDICPSERPEGPAGRFDGKATVFS